VKGGHVPARFREFDHLPSVLSGKALPANNIELLNMMVHVAIYHG